MGQEGGEGELEEGEDRRRGRTDTSIIDANALENSRNAVNCVNKHTRELKNLYRANLVRMEETFLDQEVHCERHQRRQESLTKHERIVEVFIEFLMA